MLTTIILAVIKLMPIILWVIVLLKMWRMTKRLDDAEKSADTRISRARASEMTNLLQSVSNTRELSIEQSQRLDRRISNLMGRVRRLEGKPAVNSDPDPAEAGAPVITNSPFAAGEDISSREV